jgi:hypothetical protein
MKSTAYCVLIRKLKSPTDHSALATIFQTSSLKFEF